MLERIPTVLTHQEVLDKAFQRASKIVIDDPVKYHRVRKEMLARIQSVSDTVASTLERYVKALPNLDHLRDYESEVIDIMVGLQELRRAASRIDWARQMAIDLAREAEGRMARRRSIATFHDELKRHYGRLSSVLKDIAPALEFLGMARDTMKVLPDVRPEHATVVIAGFPNVGKTSLLRAWTASRAEVAPYAFTTKHAEVGHITVQDRRGLPRIIQVVDTPGILDRPEAERNPVERQAVAALRHAADAVLFLIDPTEATPREDQERLLAEVQAQLAGLPMLVAETKGDMATTPPTPGRLRFSTASGEGLEELREAILALVPEESDLEDPLRRWQGSSQDASR